MLRRLILIATASTVVSGAEVRLAVHDRSPGGTCTRNASVVATPRTAGRDPVTSGLRQGDAITLSENESWEVRAVKDGCWSTIATWVGTDAPALTLETFASATIRGELGPRGVQRPRMLSGSIFRVVDQRGAPLAAEAEPVACTLRFPEWECEVPAQLPFDLHLEAAGFAPVYIWNVIARPGEVHQAGNRQLIAGSSLAGWVQDANGQPIQDAILTLAVLQAEHAGAARGSAGRHTAKTNARGFFQFTEIEPGEYRLTSRAAGHAPAVVPALTVRPDTAIAWPRALTHDPAVALTVAVDPVSNSDGSPWSLRVRESLPLIPGEPPATVTLAPQGNGTWSASGLRPDRYELTVTDANGSVVETRLLDLTNDAGTLTLSLHPLDVTGTITVGGEPFAGADAHLTSENGKTVVVRSDENGRFKASFPAAGTWLPTVYPHGRGRSTQVRGEPVEVTADAATIEIALPGGRLRGTVIHGHTPSRAAVHVVRGNRMAAQELTQGDGKFDFAGLPEGTYSVSAEGESGATPQPVEVRVRKDDTTDVQLVLEPLRVIAASVRTPDGRPASGAIARISTDAGLHWSEIVLGVDGKLEYHVPAGTADALLVVVSYSYPAAMTRVRLADGVRRPLTITLASQGGRVRVKPDRAWIIRDSVIAPVNAFYLPSGSALIPVAHVETGSYAICGEPQLTGTCRSLLVAPGASTVVELGGGGK